MKKILVVDNDRFILEVLKDLLTKVGHRVVTAEDGLSALDVLESFTPDVIFVDMVMPNIDGKRLCRLLRKMEGLKETYIISLSATAMEDVGEIKALGVNASIAKGPLQEMSEEILGLLEHSFDRFSPLLGLKTLGSDEIRQRGITRELLSGMRHFEVILEQMDEGIFEIAPDGRIVYANRGASFLTHLPEEDMLGRHFPALFATADRERIRGYFEKERDAAKRLSQDRPVMLNGYQVTMDVHPIPGSDGKAIVILDNVTEQKRAEDSLRKSEERYRLLFENANDAIFVLQDDCIRFPNRRAAEMFGFSADQLPESPFFDLVHEEDRDSVRERCQRSLEREDFSEACSFRMLNRSDEELWVELNAVPIQWDGRPAVLNFVRDITEKRRLEAHFQQSQRMASIGTLAGGIAHEFNNLLMVIQANASLVLYGKDQENPDYERLKNIEMVVQKGAELTRHILSFAREGTYRPEPTDINQLITQTEDLFARTRKGITLHAAYQEEIPTVEADPIQIEQVLMSLYINAMQAMPEGGEVFLETSVTQLGSEFVRSYGLEPGRYVKICVRDTGVGMDPMTRDRIFDPFFTTKGVGQGIGLGLAAAYGIIRNHGGIMDVSSESGKGSTFNIYLPTSKHRTP